jgi:hypothetical protein
MAPRRVACELPGGVVLRSLYSKKKNDKNDKVKIPHTFFIFHFIFHHDFTFHISHSFIFSIHLSQISIFPRGLSGSAGATAQGAPRRRHRRRGAAAAAASF